MSLNSVHIICFVYWLVVDFLQWLLLLEGIKTKKQTTNHAQGLSLMNLLFKRPTSTEQPQSHNFVILQEKLQITKESLRQN